MSGINSVDDIHALSSQDLLLYTKLHIDVKQCQTVLLSHLTEHHESVI